MKVDFYAHTANAANYTREKLKKAIKVSETKPDEILNSGVSLSFRANPSKNTRQVASIAPEYQGILNPVYKVGGLGNVAGEAAVAFTDYGDMDFRTFVPYYSPDNTEGGLKIRTPMIDETGKPIMVEMPKMAGNKPLIQGGKQVTEMVPSYKFAAVPADYVLKEGEQFVIHEPVQYGKEMFTAFRELEDTGIKGSVKSLKADLSGVEDVPYRIFSVKGTGINKAGNPPVYIVHTPELAKFPKAYGGGGAYIGKSFDDASYGIFSKAAIDAIPKFNTEQFGDFNPANYWLHDRQAFPSIVEISEQSSKGSEYWRGIRVHSSYHNPGRDYQGHYKNPIDFMRIVGTDSDLVEIMKNQDDYAFVREMIAKIEEVRGNKADGRFDVETILTKEEMERLNTIFKPLWGQFTDEKGEYNLCKIPIQGVKKNPYNFTAGTVSKTYGKEMRNHNTKDIAYGLTHDFAGIPTVDIVNGSSAQNLHLDEIGNFGIRNGFTEEIKAGFTPLTKEITESTEALYQAKQSNKRWLLDTIAQKAKQGTDELTKLFFSETAINGGSSVLGSLSKYKEGDVLFIGWGRPDTQKGFPTTLEGFLDYLKNPSVPNETKEHAKLLLGAGPWNADANDWKTIQEQMKEIQMLDGGRYRENVCYLNGFFSNRIVACADYANITSRYEPCGITPLESYAGGTPVISNNTGGSPDFIQPIIKGKNVTNETCFLTKHAYLVNPEVIGAKEGIVGQELDIARRLAIGKENADCIEEAMDLFLKKPDDYKKLMANAIKAKTDWYENITFNGGKSALQLYKENAWAIDEGNKVIAGQERNLEPLQTIKGSIAKKIATVQEALPSSKDSMTTAVETSKATIASKLKSVLKSTFGNKYFAIGSVALAVLGIIYAPTIIRNRRYQSSK